MPRPKRITKGGLIYHVSNKANLGATIFESKADYEIFLNTLAQACQRSKMRLLSYCILPNSWQLVVWPRHDGDLSTFMAWLTMTHSQRWHAHKHTAGTGHLYQGRYRSFPIQKNAYLLAACRQVERAPISAKITTKAKKWNYSSLALNSNESGDSVNISKWPVTKPIAWNSIVDKKPTDSEMNAWETSLKRGRPFGEKNWLEKTVEILELECTIRPKGRPRKIAS